MSDEAKKDAVSRRGFLGMGSAALAAAGLISTASAAGQEQKQYPSKDSRSASAPGPGNAALDGQNPDSFLPPPTDAGGVQTFKYPFGLAHKRMQEGGWSREVTIRELAISKTIAGVDMRLTAGGIRELHWHPNADEWQYYMCGNGRMTVFATGGRARTMDFQAGDVGYIQKTLPHYIQNTGTTDLKFLEMFKSSYYQDLSLSEWLTHTPPELVMQHLGIDKATLDAMPKENVAVMPK